MSELRRIAAFVAGVLVAVVGGVVIVTWEPDRTVAALAPEFAPPPSRFMAVGDLSVHLRDEGPRDDSLPVLLLHGTSSSLHTWDGWVRELSRTRRVIRLDLPAFGLTGPFPDGDYAVQHYVAFLTAALDSLRVPRAIVAGNSFGGQLAWSLAVLAPARVAGVVLVDASGYPRNAQSVPIGFRLAMTPGVNKLFLKILPRGIVRSSIRNTYGDPDRVTEPLVDRYFQLTLRAGNRAALPLRMRAPVDSALTARIPTIAVPTLILWGGRDRLIPPDHGTRFARDIAGSRLVTFDDLGHVPMEEDAVRTVQPVVSFLDARFPRVVPPSAPTP